MKPADLNTIGLGISGSITSVRCLTSGAGAHNTVLIILLIPQPDMTNPDVSGALRFVADELQAAEDAGQRAWIVGHVLPGWDGSAALTNPTDLFYQIVDRYSPHVIAGMSVPLAGLVGEAQQKRSL